MAIKRIQFRRDLYSNWSASNPVLADGEPAFEIDTGIFKIGSGSLNYLDLPSSNASISISGSLTDITALNNFTSSIQTEVDGLSAQTSSYLTTAAVIPNGTVSGSSQIDVTQTTNYSSINQYTDTDNLNYLNSIQVLSGSITYTDISSLNTFTSSIQIEVDGISSQTSSYLLNTTDTLNGDLTVSGSVNITDGIPSVDYITFDTTPENTPTTQGTLQWNIDELTLDLIQNDTTLQLGQEIQYNVRNNSGVTILNGTPVMAAGTLGASGRILVDLMDGSNYLNAKYFLGIATEDILDSDDGKITTFGKIRGIDTTKWNEGDILYISSSANGELTNIQPAAPLMNMPVAFVINKHANNGTIQVRVNNLNKNEFVNTEENSIINSTLTISGSLVFSNPPPTSISGSGTPGEIRIDDNYIYVCIMDGTWKRSATLSTW